MEGLHTDLTKLTNPYHFVLNNARRYTTCGGLTIDHKQSIGQLSMGEVKDHASGDAV
jgi:hypothetical protein